MKTKWLPVALYSLSLLCVRLAAQGGASIVGEVRDPSGAIMAGAKITVLNTATNVPHNTVTDAAGLYIVKSLSPGSYEVTVESPGFKRGARSGVVIQVDQEARIDFTLELGATTDTVNVTAEASITATESASNGEVIDNKKVIELPLNGRQFYGLALLVPGAYQPAENSTVGYRGGFNVAGANETNNNFSLNGIDNNDTGINGPTFLPSIDAMQEFKLLTGIFPAEYGHSSGSQVIVVTKSGGNQFHGSLFEFVRNQAFDAANYFTPAGQQPPISGTNSAGPSAAPSGEIRLFSFTTMRACGCGSRSRLWRRSR